MLLNLGILWKISLDQAGGIHKNNLNCKRFMCGFMA